MQVSGGTQVRALILVFQSSVEQGRASPLASTVVTTGGDANISVMLPENKYMQKYVLMLKSRWNFLPAQSLELDPFLVSGECTHRLR
jgi:hypothetical protein